MVIMTHPLDNSSQPQYITPIQCDNTTTINFISAVFREEQNSGNPQPIQNQRRNIIMDQLTNEGDPSNETLRLVAVMIQVQQYIKTKGMQSLLKNYPRFEQQVEHLQTLARNKIAQMPQFSHITPETFQAADINTQKILRAVRWILASDVQRTYAMKFHCPLPWKWKDLPCGTIVFTDPRVWLKKLQIFSWRSIAKRIFSIVFCLFKGLICKLATGKWYTHAELVLNEGKSFDLDKAKGAILSGAIRIAEKNEEEICFFDFALPNKDRLLQAYNQSHLDAPIQDFAQLQANLEKEATTKGLNIRAGAQDIIKVAITRPRPANYDCTQSWGQLIQQKEGYGCSATIAALFGNFGIDFGAEINKPLANISPADLSRSSFFSCQATALA